MSFLQQQIAGNGSVSGPRQSLRKMKARSPGREYSLRTANNSHRKQPLTRETAMLTDTQLTKKLVSQLTERGYSLKDARRIVREWKRL
jgi:SOS response regulatory protein OraA/RecX